MCNRIWSQSPFCRLSLCLSAPSEPLFAHLQNGEHSGDCPSPPSVSYGRNLVKSWSSRIHRITYCSCHPSLSAPSPPDQPMCGGPVSGHRWHGGLLGHGDLGEESFMRKRRTAKRQMGCHPAPAPAPGHQAEEFPEVTGWAPVSQDTGRCLGPGAPGKAPLGLAGPGAQSQLLESQYKRREGVSTASSLPTPELTGEAAECLESGPGARPPLC